MEVYGEKPKNEFLLLERDFITGSKEIIFGGIDSIQ
jgi:hypothetical protein